MNISLDVSNRRKIMTLMDGDEIRKIRQEIILHKSNSAYLEQGLEPLFVATPQSRIVVVGQAPGVRAQASAKPWNDASGVRLMKWLGVTEQEFRDPDLFAHMPMDFYYPGKGVTGDLPPRKDFAATWHGRILHYMPNVELIILVGAYAQRYYLKGRTHQNLTETVLNYVDYLPHFFPLVHPSPLNFRWFARNEWFECQLVPQLQLRVWSILNTANKLD